MNITWIPPHKLKETWPLVKEGVEKVSATCDEWIPEDMYWLIKNKVVSLHVVDSDGYAGFLITQKAESYDISLHVWAGYSARHDFNLLEQCTETLNEWAKTVGAKKITFATTRKGWARQALKLGFKPSLQTYERKVNYD